MTVASAEHAPASRELTPHLSRVYRAALLLAGDPAAAENLVLDTYSTAFAVFSRMAPGTDVTAWLYRILISAFTTAHGPGRPEAWFASMPGRPSAPPAAEPGLADPAALERLPESQVTTALQALSLASRVLVYLADAEGFAYKEIAEITGVPAAEVASRLHHARTWLRELLTARVAG